MSTLKFNRLWMATVVLAIAGFSWAQQAVPDAGTRDSKDTPAGVSVPDSPAAVELLARGQEKESQKQWKTAAEFYQDALSKYPARVVARRIDKSSGTFLYSGVASIIQERLSRWPNEGLAVYRNLYGDTANDLLSSAARDDLGTLRQIFWNYFVTDAGKTAGIRLVDSYLESGDYAAAAWAGDRLLSLHPSLGPQWGMILYRTAVAAHCAGDETHAAALLDQLRQKSPNEAGSIAGKDVLLADALAAVLHAPVPVATTRPADADTWPRFNGIDGRGDVSPTVAKLGASLTTIPMAPPDPIGLVSNQRTMFDQADKQSINNFQALGVIPVVDGGSLFFQDGRCVYAVDQDTGIALPGWSSTYSGDRNGHYQLPVFGRARNQQLTVTVSSTAVLAVMGQPDRPTVNGAAFGNVPMQIGFAGQPVSSSTVKLVCLDRETGRELWTRSPADLPASLAAVRTADYVGTPLIIPAGLAGHSRPATGVSTNAREDSVLVIARGGKDQQFDDCYLVSLSLKSGKYQWSTYLGSGTRGMDADGSGTDDPSQIAFADGRVLVMTNLGSLAAVDPAEGRIIWLSSYDRDNVANDGGMVWRGRGRRFQNGTAAVQDNKSWASNPVFVRNGRMFAMPTDAKKFFVVNAGSGAIEQQIATSDYSNADVLLGVRDFVGKTATREVAVVTSQRGIFLIDWKKYNHDSPQDALASHAPDLTGPELDTDVNPVCGRGFMTADSVYVPSRDRLYRVDWAKCKIASFYPSRGNFTGGQGPGNVLVTSQNVIVAGSTQVDVYTDLKLVQARYQQEMTSSPNDPEPRIRFAEVLYAGGQTDEALTRVDEAIGLIGGIDSMRSGKDRTLIFTSVLDFARRAETGTEKDADRKKARVEFGDKLFDRAGAAADTPREKAIYRLTRARADHENHNYADEVKLCQEILSDPSLRPVVVAENSTAADAAEASIGIAIDIDRSVYRPIEKLAAEARDKAIAVNDAEMLLAVGITYPNSRAANDARQAAVDRFEASHQPDRAIDILRMMYLNAVDPSIKAQRLQAIANDFLALRQVGPAIDRLARAAKMSPDPVMTARLDLPDGTSLQNVPYSVAVDRLRSIKADEEEARLPDFKLGTPPDSKNFADPFAKTVQSIDGVVAVAHPLTGYNNFKQILTWSASGLSVYDVGQTKPSAVVSEIKDAPQGAAWVQSKWLVWTGSDVFRFDEHGKLDWTLGLSKLPTLMVSAAGDAVVDDPGEQQNAINNIRMVQNGQLVVVNGKAQFVVRQGRMQRVIAPAGVANVLPAPEVNAVEQIISARPAGATLVLATSTGRIVCINTMTGEVAWQTRTADHAIDELLANPHFTVARLDDSGGAQVVVYDTTTGKVIGRRRFSAESTPGQLVNVALSEESTLAFTLYNRILLKDLYDPWKTAPIELTARANQDNALFVGLTQPEQLLVSGGRLVCLYDGGRFLRGYDLTGAVDPTPPLNTASNSPSVWLQVVGPRVFVLKTTGMKRYNLADPADHDSDPVKSLDGDNIAFIRHMLLGKDEAVLLDERIDRGAAGSPNVRIMAYGRAKVPGKNVETGKLDFDRSVRSPSGITDWLAAEGGLYCLNKEGRLSFLRGGRP